MIQENVVEMKKKSVSLTFGYAKFSLYFPIHASYVWNMKKSETIEVFV